MFAEQFLSELGCDPQQRERISYLVGHHHTYTDVDGMDYQILLEADFLVNANEGRRTSDAIRQIRDTVFRIAAGCRLLDSMYLR